MEHCTCKIPDEICTDTTCNCRSCGCMIDENIIEAEDVKQVLASGGKVINVLDTKYFDDCHIKGSISVPLRELSDKAQAWDRAMPIVTYCAHEECTASRQALEILEDLGFSNATAYEGGMREWKVLGLPCEGPCKMDYLTPPDDES